MNSGVSEKCSHTILFYLYAVCCTGEGNTRPIRTRAGSSFALLAIYGNN